METARIPEHLVGKRGGQVGLFVLGASGPGMGAVVGVGVPEIPPNPPWPTLPSAAFLPHPHDLSVPPMVLPPEPTPPS